MSSSKLAMEALDSLYEGLPPPWLHRKRAIWYGKDVAEKASRWL